MLPIRRFEAILPVSTRASQETEHPSTGAAVLYVQPPAFSFVLAV